LNELDRNSFEFSTEKRSLRLILLFEQIRIVEGQSIPSNALMLNGLPDAGVVGLIATSHIIGQLKMSEIAYLVSELLPPIIVLHEGLPRAPLRIFADSNLVATFGEASIAVDGVSTDNAQVG
jgi:predicted ATP-grasp superfamily ATP-dependent carboligase